MKLQVTLDQPKIDGYFWACPLNKDIKGHFFECWNWCMESQCDEFYAPSILNLFTTSEIEVLVPQWAKLVKNGGKILLGGTDFYLIARSGLRRNKDLGSINDLLFNRDNPLMSLTSIESTRKFLETLNFKIDSIEVDNNSFGYTVGATKK